MNKINDLGLDGIDIDYETFNQSRWVSEFENSNVVNILKQNLKNN